MARRASQDVTTYARNVLPDIPDARDWIYTPSLDPIAYPERVPPRPPKILDQGREGACTGFALAAVINQLCAERHCRAYGSEEPPPEAPITVSARMLYFLARQHDEWAGEGYDWSSVRGAILGWRSMGVCEEALWPNDTRDETMVSVAQAKNARSQTIGAYYRLQPRIAHFHAALNETGALVVSAQTHRGWDQPVNGRIPYAGNEVNDGGHAFAIVGYDRDGFWIQNSWNTAWGKDGLALWAYEDWNDNVMDAWVVQLAYPTPSIFGKSARSAILRGGATEQVEKPKPRRINIAGHFVHIDDGKFHDHGPYFSSEDDTRQTAELMANKEKYDHLLFYAHGGLNSPADAARRIFATKDTFKRNEIYPYHFMYDVGISETIRDTLNARFNTFARRTQGWWGDLADSISAWASDEFNQLQERPDQIVENLVRRPVSPLWDEMKQDAERAFRNADSAGTATVKCFWNALQAAQRSNGMPAIHLVGHSTGAILLAHLLRMTRRHRLAIPIRSVSLLAPACTIDLFEKEYLPHLDGNGPGARIEKLQIYCLTDQQERDDNVARLYRKSLLYLVSNALEREAAAPLLGMEKFHGAFENEPLIKDTFIYSRRNGKRTSSMTHGGFDNDPNTMNDLLKTILGKKPNRSRQFTHASLDY